jgi:hypothetical protein
MLLSIVHVLPQISAGISFQGVDSPTEMVSVPGREDPLGTAENASNAYKEGQKLRTS